MSSSFLVRSTITCFERVCFRQKHVSVFVCLFFVKKCFPICECAVECCMPVRFQPEKEKPQREYSSEFGFEFEFVRERLFLLRCKRSGEACGTPESRDP